LLVARARNHLLANRSLGFCFEIRIAAAWKTFSSGSNLPVVPGLPKQQARSFVERYPAQSTLQHHKS
jgi:hypothetical protein